MNLDVTTLVYIQDTCDSFPKIPMLYTLRVVYKQILSAIEIEIKKYVDSHLLPACAVQVPDLQQFGPDQPVPPHCPYRVAQADAEFFKNLQHSCSFMQLYAHMLLTCGRSRRRSLSC